MVKVREIQKNSEPQSINSFLIIQLVTSKERNSQFEKVLVLRSWYRDASAKRGYFREQFKKKTYETALFHKSVHESAGAKDCFFQTLSVLTSPLDSSVELYFVESYARIICDLFFCFIFCI